MEEEHVANCGHGKRLVCSCSNSLDHAAGKENVVRFREAGLIKAGDADACTDDTEEARYEELWSFPIFLGEYRYNRPCIALVSAVFS